MHRLFNEFLGTFFLMFTIAVAAVYGRAGEYAPLAIGLTLTAMVYAGGHISKAHYNPAVSLAFLIRGCYISVREMVNFILVQFAGAVAAVLIARTFFSGGLTVEPVQIDVWPALIGEFLFTFLLVWVIMNVATARANVGNQFYGIAIGSSVVGGIYSVGIISLAVFNPAVAIGLTLMGKLSLTDLWIPMAGSIAGAIAASTAFNRTKLASACSTDDTGCPPIEGEDSKSTASPSKSCCK